MKAWVWAASCAVAAITVQPAFAEDFWSSFKKDVQGLTGAIQDGIQDVIDSKQDVEETVEDVRRLEEEFSGPTDDEPRYDSAWVAELQQRLTAQGYDPGPIDGAFGNRTSRAVAAFQQHAGVEADGLPRPSMMRALRARTQGMQTAQPQRQPSWPGGPASTGGTVFGASPPTAPTAAGAYPDFVHLALRADPDAYAAQREVAGVAYRLAIADGATCEALVKRFAAMRGDVFLGRDFVLESADLLDRAVAGIGAKPAVLEVSLSDRVHFQPYDFNAGGYPLPASPLLQGGERSLTDRTSAPPCDAGLSLHHALPKQAMTVSRIGLRSLSVELENAPGASVLPMPQGDARAFEARNDGRMIDLVAHVRLEPPQEPFGPLRGRILTLEARDPATGTTLYVFPGPAEVAEVAEIPMDPFAPGYVPTYADFIHLALMSDLEAYLTEAEDAALGYVQATAGEEECGQIQMALKDEFTRRDLVAEAERQIREVARTLDSRPRQVEIPIEATYRLAGYDFDREGFPFYERQRPQLPIIAPGVMELPGGSCYVEYPAFANLAVEHQGTPGIDFLPLPPEQARAFRAAGKNSVVLRAALVVEPRAQGRGPLAGRIVALSAHDPQTDDLLYRFELDPAGPSTRPSDGELAWTPDLAAALLGAVIEPGLPEVTFDSAATGYFRRHSSTIDRGNPPPGAPLPIEAMRGRQPEVIVALNRERLRAELAGGGIEGPFSVAIEEELSPYYREGEGLIFNSFIGHQWLRNRRANSDPFRSTALSSRDLPLYGEASFLWPWRSSAELGFRSEVIAQAHLAPALELDRILQLEPLEIDVGQAVARGLVSNTALHRDRVIARWELEILEARVDERQPLISARLSGLSFRWASDEAPLTAVDVAALPTVAALRAPEVAQAAQQQRAAEARLDAILQGRTGLLLIRRAGADQVEQVVVGSKSVAEEYRTLVLLNDLGLPAKAQFLGPLGAMTAQLLRQDRDAAVFVDSDVFARELFEHVADLDLEAVPLLTERKEPRQEQTAPPPSPATAVSLETLAPGDARLLLVRRREALPIERVFEQNGAHSGSQIREVRGRAHFNRDFELAWDLPEKVETIELDEAPTILRMAPGAAVVLRREGLEAILPQIGDLDLVAIRFPSEEYQFGIPKDHTKGADAFAILGITGGMDEAAVLEELNWTFAPEEIVRAPAGDDIRVSRGPCVPERATAPGEAAEVGAYCLALGLADGRVAKVALRQGDRGRCRRRRAGGARRTLRPLAALP